MRPIIKQKKQTVKRVAKVNKKSSDKATTLGPRIDHI